MSAYDDYASDFEPDAITVDVGFVHVLTSVGGDCHEDCPHPDHAARCNCTVAHEHSGRTSDG